ncbi:hypothetical protein SDJN02_10792, partial [Cucurbita argyrosperma subsp. argyrosperma]
MPASAIGGYTIYMPLVAAHQTHRICSYTANQLGIESVAIYLLESLFCVRFTLNLDAATLLLLSE